MALLFEESREITKNPLIKCYVTKIAVENYLFIYQFIITDE